MTRVEAPNVAPNVEAPPVAKLVWTTNDEGRTIRSSKVLGLG